MDPYSLSDGVAEDGVFLDSCARRRPTSATIAPTRSRPPIDPPTAPAITPTLAPGDEDEEVEEMLVVVVDNAVGTVLVVTIGQFVLLNPVSSSKQIERCNNQIFAVSCDVLANRDLKRPLPLLLAEHLLEEANIVSSGTADVGSIRLKHLAELSGCSRRIANVVASSVADPFGNVHVARRVGRITRTTKMRSIGAGVAHGESPQSLKRSDTDTIIGSERLERSKCPYSPILAQHLAKRVV